MRQKKLLLMLTLLCTIVQGAWAEAGDTADNPITISSTKEWNTFVSNVNGGTKYSGKFVRLDADISVTEMAGSSETNSFQGTFLGNDKTLTFTKARRTAFKILQPLDFFGGEAGGLGNLPVVITTPLLYDSDSKPARFRPISVKLCHYFRVVAV